jgi:hypothetical protein
MHMTPRTTFYNTVMAFVTGSGIYDLDATASLIMEIAERFAAFLRPFARKTTSRWNEDILPSREYQSQIQRIEDGDISYKPTTFAYHLNAGYWQCLRGSEAQWEQTFSYYILNQVLVPLVSIIYIAKTGTDALVPACGQHYTDATAPHQGTPEDSYTSSLNLVLESIYDGQMERQIAASEAHLYE